jgi:hypothetical protein
MHNAQTWFPKNGTPPAGYRHIGFRFPDDTPVVIVVQLDPEWTVSVLIEEDTRRVFCVGVSPDSEGLTVLRFLAAHSPTRIDYADSAAQTAALGVTASTATPEELATAAAPLLTVGDDAPVIPPPTHVLQPISAMVDKPGRRTALAALGTYRFRSQMVSSGPRTVVVCGTKPSGTFATKSQEANLLQAFSEGEHSVYFIFDDGADYYVEALCCPRFRVRRLEARSPKAAHVGQTNEQVVQALIPSLAPG